MKRSRAASHAAWLVVPALVLGACSSGSELLSGSGGDGDGDSANDAGAGENDAAASLDSGAAFDASTTSDAASKDAGASDANVADTGPSDTTPPVVTLVSPTDGIGIDERRVTVVGSVSDDVHVASLSYVVGTSAATDVTVASDGSFTFTFVPAPGENTFTLTAHDDAGNTGTASRKVWFGHRISVGNSQSVMLSGGKLYTWGRNELGQLGNGTLTGTWSASDDAGLPSMYVQNASNLVSVVTRQTFMIALASDGTVETWGSNATGQLGYATASDCGTAGTSPCGRTPQAVPGIGDAVAIAAGFDHALVLRADGTVLAFGSNALGQLGSTSVTGSTTTPTAVPDLANVIAIGATSANSIALTADGKVFVWGSNQYGQLGTGGTDTNPHATPTEIAGLTAASIAGANFTIYARTPEGELRAWGQNASGQIGNGTTTTVLTPTAVLTNATPATPLTNVESIAADGFVGLALTHDRKTYAWGLGSLGQLAQGQTGAGARDLANRTVASPIYVTPADQPSFTPVELEVGAGGPAFVYTGEGKLFGWGWSFQGSLGGGGTLINAWAYTTPFLVVPPAP